MDAPESEIPTIDVEELEELTKAGAEILDVREMHEYLETRIAGVVHIPLDEIPHRCSELNPESNIYVVCAKGGRSAKAVEYLNANGYQTVNVAGGTDAWVEAGKAYESG